MTYQQQLQDPRWHDKRREVLILHEYKCDECREAGEIHIHHRRYDLSKMAWEYENDNFSCLCAHHHKLKHIPDCCHTPVYKHVYDPDMRSDILLLMDTNYCPTCGVPHV